LENGSANSFDRAKPFKSMYEGSVDHAVEFPAMEDIPLGRFELPSPDPKSCMIDHYTTGVKDQLTNTLDVCLMRGLLLSAPDPKYFIEVDVFKGRIYNSIP
jgi:hypothetical protein